MEEIRLVAASGGLGGGKIDAAALAAAMEDQPHFIASDAGTTDSGPFSLGSGRPQLPARIRQARPGAAAAGRPYRRHPGPRGLGRNGRFRTHKSPGCSTSPGKSWPSMG